MIEKFKRIIFVCWDLNETELQELSKKCIKDCIALNINITKKKIHCVQKNLKLINIDDDEANAIADKIMEHFDILKYEKWQPYNVEKINLECEDKARLIFKKLSEYANAIIMHRNTILTRSKLFIDNFFKNIKKIKNKIHLSEFKNGFLNKPFLIVAAGPSLDKQLETLSIFQEYFYIIAVDKAYPSLKKYNIIPDFIITIDAESTPSWEQDGLNEKTIFIVDIGSNPDIVNSTNINHLFISSNSEATEISKYFECEIETLETGGSVATSAFNFAHLCGANPISFIGQDLAFTDGKDHALDYIEPYAQKLIDMKIESGFWVDGYYGKPVQTEKQLLMYKYWFENKFQTIKNIFIFNCTEGGANIKGANNIPFKKLCEEIKGSTLPKINILNHPIKLDNDCFNPHQLQIIIRKLINDLDNLEKNCISTIDSINGKSKLSSKGRDSLEATLTKIKNLDLTVKFLIERFNQIELYQNNKSIAITEKKTNSDLNQHYVKFLKSTIVSINSCKNFFNKLKEDLISDY